MLTTLAPELQLGRHGKHCCHCDRVRKNPAHPPFFCSNEPRELRSWESSHSSVAVGNSFEESTSLNIGLESEGISIGLSQSFSESW